VRPRSVAQWLEHRSPKPGVAGSSPATPASKVKGLIDIYGDADLQKPPLEDYWKMACGAAARRPDSISSGGLVMKTIATCLALLLGAGPAFAADQYLCITEAAAGLHYDRQTERWGPMVFKPGDKYIVHRFTGKQRDAFLSDPKLASLPNRNLEAWGILRFGDNSGYNITTCITLDGSGDCGDDFFLPTHRGSSLDLNSLRFQLVRPDGYIRQGSDQYLKQTNPQEYQKMAQKLSVDRINHPDDLAIEIGKCSPLN
jgi:hypothetical protein